MTNIIRMSVEEFQSIFERHLLVLLFVVDVFVAAIVPVSVVIVVLPLPLIFFSLPFTSPPFQFFKRSIKSQDVLSKFSFLILKIYTNCLSWVYNCLHVTENSKTAVM